MRFTAFILTVFLLPSFAYAGEDVPLETQCRQELDLGSGALLPGIDRGRLRSCIRLKTAQSRRKSYIRRETSRTIERKATVQERELKRQEANTDAGIERTFVRNPHEQTCRQQMGVLATTILPGPQLGELRSCINRLSAEAVKSARVRRTRDAVLRRSEYIHNKVQQVERQKQSEAKMEKVEKVKMNRRSIRKPDAARFAKIRDAGRVRTDFTRERALDSRTVKRNAAAACRKVEPKNWASCIREALQ